MRKPGNTILFLVLRLTFQSGQIFMFSVKKRNRKEQLALTLFLKIVTWKKEEQKKVYT